MMPKSVKRIWGHIMNQSDEPDTFHQSSPAWGDPSDPDRWSDDVANRHGEDTAGA